MSDVSPIVFVVDDGASVRKSSELLIHCEDRQPERYGSSQEFFNYPQGHFPICLVLDVSCPNLTALYLQRLDVESCTNAPIIERGE